MMPKAIYVVILMMISGCSGVSGRSQTMDFRDFVREFFRSEDFQASHIHFPLEVISWTGDGGVSSTFVTENEWSFYEGPAYFQCNESCYDIMIYDDFDKRQRDSGERVLAFEGVSNGINSSVYFRLTDGNWYLIKIEDFNN